jgi:hypothetical protein
VSIEFLPCAGLEIRSWRTKGWVARKRRQAASNSTW